MAVSFRTDNKVCFSGSCQAQGTHEKLPPNEPLWTTQVGEPDSCLTDTHQYHGSSITQLVDSIETRSCQYYHGIHKTKKSEYYAFLPLSVPLLLLSSAPKVAWSYQYQPDCSFWGGEGSPTPEGDLRAATLSFHSLCSGAPLSVPSKMPEHTRISEVSGADPEDLQGGERGGSSIVLHFRPHAEWSPPGTLLGSQQKHVI